MFGTAQKTSDFNLKLDLKFEQQKMRRIISLDLLKRQCEIKFHDSYGSVIITSPKTIT